MDTAEASEATEGAQGDPNTNSRRDPSTKRAGHATPNDEVSDCRKASLFGGDWDAAPDKPQQDPKKKSPNSPPPHGPNPSNRKGLNIIRDLAGHAKSNNDASEDKGTLNLGATPIEIVAKAPTTAKSKKGPP